MKPHAPLYITVQTDKVPSSKVKIVQGHVMHAIALF